MMRGVPRRILWQVQKLLAEDEFIQSTSGLFCKRWNGSWMAWISVPGTPHILLPRVGIYDEELLRIEGQTQKKLGTYRKQPGGGPPLIMVNLERLIGDDADCFKRSSSWDYHGDATTVGPELETSVADDLVYCLRKKAYPWFGEHLSYEAVLDAARAGMSSPALQLYIPIILLKMGRSADVRKYVDELLRTTSNNDLAEWYNLYVNTVVEIFEQENGR